MALDKTRPYSEHDGSMDKDVRYMQDNKHYRADETEILSEADLVKVAKAEAAKVEAAKNEAAKAEAVKTKTKAPVELDANLA